MDEQDRRMIAGLTHIMDKLEKSITKLVGKIGELEEEVHTLYLELAMSQTKIGD